MASDANHVESAICENGKRNTLKTMGMNTAAADVRFTALIADESSSVSSCSEDFTCSDEDLEQKEMELEKEKKEVTGDDGALRTSGISRQGSVHHSATLPNIPLHIKDDHFAPPEGCFDATTVGELESAVENYKALAKGATPHTDQARELIKKLVQLRLKLLEAKEGPVMSYPNVKHVMGHLLVEKPWGSSQSYCERCNGLIMGIVQSWLRCEECGFCCHRRCLNFITRTCASLKVSENPTLSLTICPEKGLHVQNYRCLECRTAIGFQPGMHEPRLCDYTGSFYCDHCHWNDTMAIPARILGNWDFEPRKLCRSSKQFLRLMLRKPVLCIQRINPMLFSYLSELNDVRKLREEILIMKKYFLECTDALRTNRLLLQLSERQHFVENSDMYSLQDLIDLANDVLLPEITKIHANFAQHIKTECEKCRQQGSTCVICNTDEVLFPFDFVAFVCPNCSAILHRDCYSQKNNRCPQCLQKKERNSITADC